MQRVYLKYEDDTIVAGLQPMLKILSVSKPTFTKWVKEGLPFEMRGKTKVYKLDEVRIWIDKNIDYSAELERIKLEAQTEEIKARTIYKKIQIKEKKRELISIDELSSSQDALIDMLMSKDMLHLKRCTDPKLKKELDKHYKAKWDDIHDDAQSEYEAQEDNLDKIT